MLQLDLIQTVGAAGLVLGLGYLLQKYIPGAKRYNLPAPVLGGLVVALVISIMHGPDGTSPISFDTTSVKPLLITFFTIVGFGASWNLLKKGGPQVLIYLIACTVLLIFQNIIGVAVSYLFNLHPLFGVLSGSVALTGGPGTAMAFSEAFEHAGVNGAATIGIAAAMSGIILGGLLGGPVSTILIERLALKSKAKGKKPEHIAPDKPVTMSVSAEDILKQVVILVIVMWLGSYVSKGFESFKITLPAYIGSMIVAAIVRNLDDHFGWFGLNGDILENIANVALALFLALTIMTLKLWEITGVATPLIVILVAQSIFIVVVALTIMFKIAGRDYEAAVMSGGMVGFMMGTTANAMANMDAVTRKYGLAPRAYLVVPLVGACFVDFTNAAFITAAINFFKG